MLGHYCFDSCNGSYYHAAQHAKAGDCPIRPLSLVPFGYLIAGPISRWLDGFFPSVSFDLFRVSFTLIALVFACILFGMLAGNMGGKAARRAYMFLCGGFSVILSIVLIHSIRPF